VLHRNSRIRIDLFLRRTSAIRRTWRSSDGSEVDASLVKAEGDVVTLKRIDDGRSIDVNVQRLHPEDRAWLKKEVERNQRLPDM
jgi:hypothetical protein